MKKIQSFLSLAMFLFFVLPYLLSNFKDIGSGFSKVNSFSDDHLVQKILSSDRVKSDAANLTQLATKLFYKIQYDWRSGGERFHSDWHLYKKWLRESTAFRMKIKSTYNSNYPHSIQVAAPYGIVDQGYYDTAAWGWVYHQIFKKDANRINNIAAAFAYYEKKLGLSKHQLATLMLNFVQSIPYKVPQNNIGLYTPFEVLDRATGDCDSKSLLYYILLRKMGIDAVILVSRHYKHAMVGVDVTTGGEFFPAFYKRFYFTEVTGKGHRIGGLPAQSGDKKRWYAVKIN